MELLQERIRREGRVLPGNIVKVDGFLNHRVDTRLLEDIADEFAKYFDTSKITVVLTAEASGIALATICAQKYGVPMLFAKKAKSDNIESGLYQSEVFSYTYKKRVTLLVSQEWLNADDHVLIIDDFMANGFAVQGLVDIVNEAGAKLEGIGIAVEKGFQVHPALWHTVHQAPYIVHPAACRGRCPHRFCKSVFPVLRLSFGQQPDACAFSIYRHSVEQPAFPERCE